MSRLPGINTGNGQIDYLLQMIDEQLSELYSLHGKQVSRSSITAPTIVLTENLVTPNAAVKNALYANSILKGGVAVTDTGLILWSFNMNPSAGAGSSKTATGEYSYDLAVEMNVAANNAGAPIAYAAMGCLNDLGFPVANAYTMSTNITLPSTVKVNVSSAGAAADADHTVLVFGNQ